MKPEENEAAAVLSSLKTAEIKFQQEKIETLENTINRISKVYREQEERDLEIQQLGQVADQPDDGMEQHNSFSMIKIIFKFVVLLKIFPHLPPAYYRRLFNIISFLESA